MTRSISPALRFGVENMRESRRLFFSDLQGLLERMGIDPYQDVNSVFEFGCSLGYQLRHIETSLFPGASIIEGLDIDGYAIESGKKHLGASGSKVKLYRSDMESFEDVTGAKVYDIIICSGVLMYLSQEPATRLVERMLKHTGKVLAFAGLAHDADNSGLKRSVVRERDGTFVHNIDEMVKSAGARILQRRWEGGRIVDGNTIYFVFATA
jgi:SAM-dependent methyltransferase